MEEPISKSIRVRALLNQPLRSYRLHNAILLGMEYSKLKSNELDHET